ncbi:unnamed protein product [Danaus chrysippus]|uniref:(African queen) hypothetical protein n=1 Tax=Danaus chrysippus TaxID=151541 RepID=A0A8J2QMR4_9NEOP|nr:unnamed protein product [Danaus chrysippus]
MSTISNGTLDSLDQRVYIEKASERLLSFLNPEPMIYYTHNPAILFWTFTSLRIPDKFKIIVLSEWFKTETSLPEDIAKETLVWELVLNVIIQSKDKTISENCMEALNTIIEDGDEADKEEFAAITWGLLPEVLSKASIDSHDVLLDTNITYILDIATSHPPSYIEQSICIKVAVFITTLFTKSITDIDFKARYDYECACLKLCLILLGMSKEESDNKVSLTYINREGFLSRVLSSIGSSDDGVSHAAVELLTYIVYNFTMNKYQPTSVLEIQTDVIINYLRQDRDNERSTSLLQLIYMILNSVPNTPLVLNYNFFTNPSENLNFYGLRALMFRVQMMLCSRDSKNQSPTGWKTLSSIFKYAISYKNDPKLVATLTSQPWTHTLIRFQLTQNITQEFLTFTQNWLTLLKITIRKNREITKYYISKHSLIYKTLTLLKNNLNGDDLKENKKELLVVVNDIMEYGQSRD